MPRQTLPAHPDAPSPEILAASAKLRESLPPPRKTKRRSFSVASIEKIKAEADEMRLANDYARASIMHIVAMWAWCHESMYGVAPSMTMKEWSLAGILAGQLLAKEFPGRTPGWMIVLLKWTWGEEGENVEWRRKNKKPITPIGWRWQFSSKLVVKWRANGGK